MLEENKIDEVKSMLPSLEDRSTYLLVKSLLEDKLGNFDRRIVICQEILDMDDPDPVAVTFAYSGLLWSYFRKGDYRKAQSYLEKYEISYLNHKHLLKDEFPLLESSILNSRGSIALETGDNDLAEKSFKKSLKLLRVQGERRRIASLQNNLALVYQKQGKFNEAIKLYNDSLSYYEGISADVATCRVKSNLAEVYRFKTQYKIALEYHKEVLQIRERMDSNYDLALSNFYVGQVYYDIGRYESALLYLTQSRQQWQAIGNGQWLSLTLLILGKVLIELDQPTDQIDQKFKKLLETSDNPLIQQRYQLFSALVLKHSNRMANVAQSQKKLERLVKSEILDYELTYDAIMAYTDLLLLELTITEDKSLYERVKIEISTLELLAKDNNAYGKIVDVLLLRAKMAIIELEYEKAERIIMQAEMIAVENDLPYYQILVDKIRMIFVTDMMKMKSIVDDNKNLLERAEIVELKDYLRKAQDIKNDLDR